jgi:hypothetical protein
MRSEDSALGARSANWAAPERITTPAQPSNFENCIELHGARMTAIEHLMRFQNE